MTLNVTKKLFSAYKKQTAKSTQDGQLFVLSHVDVFIKF